MNKPLALITTIVALAASPAFSGTEQTVTVTANVPAILALETSASTVTFNLADSDYSTGTNSDTAVVEAAAAHTLQVRSNLPWAVSVKAGAGTFTGPTGTSKSAGDLEVKAAGSYAALTTSDATLKSGTAGGYSSNTFNVDYRLTSSLTTDEPGDYTLAVVYTVALQ